MRLSFKLNSASAAILGALLAVSGCVQTPPTAQPPAVQAVENVESAETAETSAEPSPLPAPDRLYFNNATEDYFSKCGALDSSGKIVIPFEYSSYSRLANDRYTLSVLEPETAREKCALADSKGNLLTGFDYFYITDSGDGLLFGSLADGSGCRMLDADTGKPLLELEGEYTACGVGGSAALLDYGAGVLRLYSAKALKAGQTSPLMEYTGVDYTLYDTENILLGAKLKDGVVVFFTENGLLSDVVYDDVSLVSNGRAAVMKDGKWGFINVKGEQIVPMEYDSVGFYTGDYMLLSSGELEDGTYETTTLVDKNGAIVASGVLNCYSYPQYGCTCAVLQYGKGEGVSTLYSLAHDGKQTLIGDYYCYDICVNDAAIMTTLDYSQTGLYDLAKNEWLIPVGSSSLFWIYSEGSDRVLGDMYEFKGGYLTDIYSPDGTLLLDACKNVYYADSSRAVVLRGFKYGMTDYTDWLYEVSIFTGFDQED